MASPPLAVEPEVAFQPTVKKPTTDCEFAAVLRMPFVGVVVPIPTLPVKSAMNRAVGALNAPMAKPLL